MKVKIKTWNEMLEGNSLDVDGDITLTNHKFTTNMEILLPEDRIINVVENLFFIGVFNWFIEDSWFTITQEMIESSEYDDEESDYMDEDFGSGYYYGCED